jgi:uncharacterized protein (TIGR01777 family)
MKVFLTGASGFIGRRLLRELLRRGDHVVALTRRARHLQGASHASGAGESGSRLVVVEGDPTQAGAWQQQVAGCDAVVALAGEPVMDSRWTDSFKRRVIASRVEGMRRMVEALVNCPIAERPKTLISASATGYYGSTEHKDEELDENTPSGHDFLARVCVDWEAGADAAAAHGVRVVKLRIGIVFGQAEHHLGGALEKMIPAFRFFVGGPIGSGEQYVPWVHLDDVIGLALLALDRPEARGSINLTSPNPVKMRELAKSIGAALHRPALFRVPEFALKLALGEAAQALLGSQRVIPRRATELGYRFQHPELAEALRASLSG